MVTQPVIDMVNCGVPEAPSNGGVDVDKTSVGSSIVYHCKQGFVLSGDTQRVCKPNGRWSGSEPTCKSKFLLCKSVCSISQKEALGTNSFTRETKYSLL